MRRLLMTALVCLGVAALSGLAQAENAAAARARYESGVQHFDLAEYEPALADFKEAYRNKPVPVFLFNIAQCHRKLGHLDEAITFYQTYLRREPDAKNREEVERRIAELKTMSSANHVSTSPGGKAQPAPTAVAPTRQQEGGALASPPAPPAQPDPALATPTAAPAAATPPALAALDFTSSEPAAAEPSGGVFSRWWFWTAAGAVAVGGATVAIIMAGRDPTKVPSTDLGSQKVLP